MLAPIHPDVVHPVTPLIAQECPPREMNDLERTAENPCQTNGSTGADRGVQKVSLHSPNLSRLKLGLVFLRGSRRQGHLRNRHGGFLPIPSHLLCALAKKTTAALQVPNSR